jgi:hypothetical protein
VPDCNVIMIQDEFQVKFECRKAPSRSAINRLLNKSEMSGRMITIRRALLVRRSLSEHQKTLTVFSGCYHRVPGNL